MGPAVSAQTISGRTFFVDQRFEDIISF